MEFALRYEISGLGGVGGFLAAGSFGGSWVSAGSLFPRDILALFRRLSCRGVRAESFKIGSSKNEFRLEYGFCIFLKGIVGVASGKKSSEILW